MSEKKNVTTKLPSDSQKNLDCFENREKRLGITFKVIYVMSFFWLVFVASLLSLKNGNMTTGMTAAMLAAGVSIIIISLVRYVYNELMCLKMNPNNKDKNQRDKTEASYNRIFKDVKIGFFVSIAIWVIYLAANTYLGFIISRGILVWPLGISLIVYLIFLQIKKNHLRVIVEDFLCIVFFYSFYAFILI